MSSLSGVAGIQQCYLVWQEYSSAIWCGRNTAVLSGVAGIQQCYLVFQSEQGNPRDLFSPTYLRTTLQVWVLWFGTALSYYGMVLASAEILQLRNAAESGQCHKSWTIPRRTFSMEQFSSIFVPGN